MLLAGQEFGGMNCFDQSGLICNTALRFGTLNICFVDFPIDARAFVDSMDFTHQKFLMYMSMRRFMYVGKTDSLNEEGFIQ